LRILRSEAASFAMPIWKRALNNTIITLGGNDVFGQDPPHAAALENYADFLYDSSRPLRLRHADEEVLTAALDNKRAILKNDWFNQSSLTRSKIDVSLHSSLGNIGADAPFARPKKALYVTHLAPVAQPDRATDF
jgi:hypothetical protein